MKIKEKKKELLKDINILFKNSSLIIILEYLGITSLNLKYVRQELFKNNIEIRVFKNTLIKKVLDENNNKLLKNNIFGQVLTIFSKNSFPSILKMISNIINNNIELKIRNIYIHKKNFSGNDLNFLLNLYDKETALYEIINIVKTPIFNLFSNIEHACIHIFNLLNIIKENKKTETICHQK